MQSSRYYRILGVSENAGIREIKNAFRLKAKAYHPDINKTKGAHEKFIDINEAYTYLINLHSRETSDISDQSDRDEHYIRWMERERQKARVRAAKRAKMKFEEFQRSTIYRTTSRLSHMLDYFLLFLGIFIIIAAGFGLYTQGLYVEDNGDEVLNISGIVANIIITFAGTLFLLLSWSNIRTYRKKGQKYWKNSY